MFKDGFKLNNRLSVLAVILVILGMWAQGEGYEALYHWAYISFFICTIWGGIAVAFETAKLFAQDKKKEWNRKKARKEAQAE